MRKLRWHLRDATEDLDCVQLVKPNRAEPLGHGVCPGLVDPHSVHEPPDMARQRGHPRAERRTAAPAHLHIVGRRALSNVDAGDSPQEIGDRMRLRLLELIAGELKPRTHQTAARDDGRMPWLVGRADTRARRFYMLQ